MFMWLPRAKGQPPYTVFNIVDSQSFSWSVKILLSQNMLQIAYEFTTSKSLNTVRVECREIRGHPFLVDTDCASTSSFTSNMARPQPRSHCREYESSAPYHIPIPRSCTTRNTSWSSSPSRTSIPLSPRSICTMCCLYTLFLVGLVCACGAVFYLVERYLLKDDNIVTAANDVISTTPVDTTTDCDTTKTPEKPTVKTTPTTTTAKEKSTTKNRTATTTSKSGEDSSSCSDSNPTAESSTSKYKITTTNSLPSETTPPPPHPPLNESNYDSVNSTTADCVTLDSSTPPPTPTDSCTNDTDDSTATSSSSSDSKTQIHEKPSYQGKDESTSTDCSSSVEDTAAVNSFVVGENREGGNKEDFVDSESNRFL